MSEWQEKWGNYSPLLAFSILFHLLFLWVFLHLQPLSLPSNLPNRSPFFSVSLGEEGSGEKQGEAEELPAETQSVSKNSEESPLKEEQEQEKPEEQQVLETSQKILQTPENPQDTPEEEAEPPHVSPTLSPNSTSLGLGSSPALSQEFQSLLKKRSTSGSVSFSALASEEILSSRSPRGRQESVERYGGSGASEDAVELALLWFSRHQSSDGSWNTTRFNEQCACKDKGYDTYIPATTALVLLCYTGAGYSHTQGPYRKGVRQGMEYLLSIQEANGRLGLKNMYNHAIAMLALAELYALTKEPLLRHPLEQAIVFTQSAQQKGGGFSYAAHPPVSRNDSSITAWVLMALITSHLAHLPVPVELFQGIAHHFSQMTDPDGSVLYADVGENANRGGLGMLAVGLYARLALGFSSQEALSQTQIHLLLKNPPRWNEAKNLNNSMYYWYYGSMALFLSDPVSFRRWNQELIRQILPQQCQKGHEKGSFDPVGLWGKHGGRLYSTAILTLSLEMYYKYSPHYLNRLSAFKVLWEHEKKAFPWEKRETVGKR